MTPHEKTKHRDRQTREGDKLVTKDVFARKVRDQLADYSHAGQNHDVNRRMRVKPKQVLEENRIATRRGIENADVGQALKRYQQNRDRNYRCPQNHD